MVEVPAAQPLILVVDDHVVEALLLERFLTRHGYRVAKASQGLDAVRLVGTLQPDLVLLDADMPVMDGFTACTAIKEHPCGREVPVIMVTAMDDDGSVDRAFAAGAEEYVTKPVHWAVLRQRIRLLLNARRTELQRREAEAERERVLEEISRHRDQLSFERAVIEGVLHKIREANRPRHANIRALMTSVEKTTGDLLLVAERDGRVQSVLVGDFTGHGLTAAIGSPIVSGIFHAMTGKGFPATEILRETNRQLSEKLPTGMFMAACFIEYDRTRSCATLYNAGMPDILHYRGSRLVARVPSSSFPFGITESSVFSLRGDPLVVEADDRLYACSDGILDATAPDGRFFGSDGLEEVLAAGITNGHPLERLVDLLIDFRGNQEIEDDVTLVEMTC